MSASYSILLILSYSSQALCCRGDAAASADATTLSHNSKPICNVNYDDLCQENPKSLQVYFNSVFITKTRC